MKIVKERKWVTKMKKRWTNDKNFVQHEGKGNTCSALLLGLRWVSQARHRGCRSWGFGWWVGSRDGESGLPKIPLTRLSVAIATIATLVVALVGWFGLGCSSMTGSHLGTTGVVGS